MEDYSATQHRPFHGDGAISSTTRQQDPLTAAQVAAELGVTVRRVVALIDAGRFPSARRFGRSWMIDAEDLKLADVRERRPGGKRKREQETKSQRFSKQRIKEALRSVADEQTKTVVRLIYGIGCEPHSYSEVGKAIGVSKQRVGAVVKVFERDVLGGRCG